MGKGDKKKEGTRIIKNFKNQIELKKQRESPVRLTKAELTDYKAPDINIL
jgi:hypothetical protein